MDDKTKEFLLHVLNVQNEKVVKAVENNDFDTAEEILKDTNMCLRYMEILLLNLKPKGDY